MFPEIQYIFNKVTKLLCQCNSSFNKKTVLKIWGMWKLHENVQNYIIFIHLKVQWLSSSLIVLPYSPAVIGTRIIYSFLLIPRTLSWSIYPVILHHHKTCYHLCLATWSLKKLDKWTSMNFLDKHRIFQSAKVIICNSQVHGTLHIPNWRIVLPHLVPGKGGLSAQSRVKKLSAGWPADSSQTGPLCACDCPPAAREYILPAFVTRCFLSVT